MQSRTPDQALFDFAHSGSAEKVVITDDPMPHIVHTIQNVYWELHEAAKKNSPETRERIELARRLQYITDIEKVTLLQVLEKVI